jgi:hypothetical protein
MHVKDQYISAILDAIDFIVHNTDGASHEHDESHTVNVLNEILDKMEQSQHKRLVRYYVRKRYKNSES